MGFHHEHQRPDRDQYINITKGGMYDNVLKKYPEEFLNSTASFSSKEYDILSLMHYDGFMNGFWDASTGPAIIDLKTGQAVPKNTKMSKLDIKTLNKMYPCNNQGQFHI